MLATHKVLSYRLLTRSYLAGYSQGLTHKVLSCKLPTRSSLASYSQGLTHKVLSCRLLTRTYSQGLILQATHKVLSRKLLTRSYSQGLIFRLLMRPCLAGYSRVHILQVTHEVISCRLLTRSHLASYSRGHVLLCTLQGLRGFAGQVKIQPSRRLHICCRQVALHLLPSGDRSITILDTEVSTTDPDKLLPPHSVL